MADSDEEVVFENSPLHEHLRNIGYNAEDVNPVMKHSNEHSKIETAKKAQIQPKDHKKVSNYEQLKASLRDYIFDEGWHCQVSHLYAKSSRQLVEEVVKSSAVCEEDAAYVESFCSTLDNNPREEAGDGIMGQMLTSVISSVWSVLSSQIGVLTVTMAYGFIRMFYMKHSDFAAGAYVYMLDALSVAMTIVALAPAALKFAMIGRLLSQLQMFNAAASKTLIHVHNFERTLTKTLMFIQEVEVIQRGFTLITAPVSRLELGILKGSDRQCSELRRVIFHRAKKVMLQVKSATNDLLKQVNGYVVLHHQAVCADIPLRIFQINRQNEEWTHDPKTKSTCRHGLIRKHIELEGLSSYLACIPLEEFGAPINVPDDQMEQLKEATDDFCLGSLKALSRVTNAQLSEFLRVLCVLCLIQADEHRRTNASGYTDQVKVLKNVEDELTSSLRLLEKSFTLHRNLELNMEKIHRQSEDNRMRATETSNHRAVFKAVRSLRLHLQTTLQRIQMVDEQLESTVDDSSTLSQQSSSIPESLQAQLSSDLDYARCQLAACRDCWDEADRRLSKLRGVETQSPAVTESVSVVQNLSAAKQPVPVDCKPIIEDQVFEGYPEYSDIDSSVACPLLTEEEKRDQREALRVLSELKSVIAARARETSERERSALLRQNPDYKFDAEDETSRPTPDSPSGDQASERVKSASFDPSSDLRDREAVNGVEQLLNETVAAVTSNLSCSFSKHVAMLASAKSKQMATLPVETFGCDSEDSYSDSEEEVDNNCDSDGSGTGL